MKTPKIISALDLLVHFVLRVVLGVGLFLAIVLVGFCSLPNGKDRKRLAECTWVPIARVKLGDTVLDLPALPSTSIHFGYPIYKADGPLHTYAKFNVGKGKSSGFCDTDLTGSPNRATIMIDHQALLPLLADIDLTQQAGLRLLSIRNSHTTPAEIEVIEGQPDIFVVDPSTTPKGPHQPLEKLRTAGWVNGTHVVSTACMVSQSDVAPFFCSYGILRREDAVEVRLTGILTDEMPQAGKQNDAILQDLLAKFDAVLEHYAPAAAPSE